MRRAAIVLASAALFGAGCGSSGPGATPAACLQGATIYLKALEAAPDPVRLAGTTPISACLVDSQSVGDQADVGESLVKATTLLNVAARHDPAGPRAVALGYMVGAIQRGAAGTGAIHAELVRRVEAAARFEGSAGSPPPAFDLAYARGFAAGRGDG